MTGTERIILTAFLSILGAIGGYMAAKAWKDYHNDDR